MQPDTGTIIIILAVALVLIALAFLPEALRILGRHAYAAFFAISLVACIAVIGTSAPLPEMPMRASIMDVSWLTGSKKTDEVAVKRGIEECKTLVQLRMTGPLHPSRIAPAAGTGSPGRKGPGESLSMWDICADRFGNNFWKHDTSIGERRGGDVLCDLHRKNDLLSHRAAAWCDTVFTPGTPETASQPPI